VPEHDHEDFDSVVIGLDELESPESLIKRIEILAQRQNILRVKGYAAVKGKPMRLLVQAVGARVRAQYDRPWAPDEMRMGRVVVIAEHDHIDRNAIESTLKG
jgi:cobalamin biosynthesis protein CobW